MRTQTSFWIEEDLKKEVKKILIEKNSNLSFLINKLLKKFKEENAIKK